MDFFDFVKNHIQVRNIANGAIKSGSKIMAKYLYDLSDINNSYVSKTEVHKANIDNDTKDIKGAIIISNHPSFFDLVIIKKLLDCYCLTDNVDKDVIPEELYIEYLHIVPYYRDDKNSGSNAKDIILKLVKEGKKVLVFPEGQLQTGEEIRTFKKGLFHMAYDNKIPIISLNILRESKFNDTFLECVLAYIQLPLEPPKTDVYYNEVIYPQEHSSFESFFDTCFESVSNGYYTRLEEAKRRCNNGNTDSTTDKSA